MSSAVADAPAEVAQPHLRLEVTLGVTALAIEHPPAIQHALAWLTRHTTVAASPEAAVGAVLYRDEVLVMRALGARLLAMLAELPRASTTACRVHPRWAEVVCAARRARSVIDRNGGIRLPQAGLLAWLADPPLRRSPDADGRHGATADDVSRLVLGMADDAGLWEIESDLSVYFFGMGEAVLRRAIVEVVAGLVRAGLLTVERHVWADVDLHPVPDAELATVLDDDRYWTAPDHGDPALAINATEAGHAHRRGPARGTFPRPGSPPATTAHR
ncbi:MULTISPECIES: hypothetical protein [unclassified Actinotalea]|uniref:hypothetical protein n=1 Tax=unclassified Actinotalea TaxID=2638618 RepID=UPI0015F638B1|nr:MULTISPECIES: hypothetical protein [unclassified Actinotalea]